MKLLVLMVLLKINCMGILNLHIYFFVQSLAETTEGTISEQLVSTQQNHVCQETSSFSVHKPICVSVNSACYRMLSPALQVLHMSRAGYRSLALLSSISPITLKEKLLQCLPFLKDNSFVSVSRKTAALISFIAESVLRLLQAVRCNNSVSPEQDAEHVLLILEPGATLAAAVLLEKEFV